MLFRMSWRDQQTLVITPNMCDLGQVHYLLRGSMFQVKGSGGANSTAKLSWLSCRGGAEWGPVVVALSADLMIRP